MNSQKKVAFYTLGCKLNFSETSTIARQFIESGYQRVEFEEQPDVYVINTCSVTDHADKKCKQLVKKALSVSPHAYIAIIGCYAQLKPHEIAEIQGVDIVLGANEKFNLVQYITTTEKSFKAEVHACEINEVNAFLPAYSSSDRTRTFLKIQDGCDYSCSFCTIPLARGKSRSGTIAETVEIVKKSIQETGAREIVLTGVNTGDFGKAHDENFLGLIKELDDLNGVERFRISSIEPNLLNNEIIQFVANSQKFVPHFHIPLQSGSNAVLRRMRRRYQRELYFDRVNEIKRLIPNCCIGVDVIVGFPGESNEEFQETYSFLQSLDISYLHVFTYSERDNTNAAHMKGRVPERIRSERSKMLHILSEKKKRHFYQSCIGQEEVVLWEEENKNELMFGFTRNYIKVKRPYDKSLVNTTELLVLEGIAEDGIMNCKQLIEKQTLSYVSNSQ